MCIVDNSVSIVLSPMDKFLLWSRIIYIIDTLVLIVMASRATWEKALMESINFMRDQNSGIISENSAKLKFSYHLSSIINLSDVSGISGVARLFKFLMSCRVTNNARVKALSYSLMDATWYSVRYRTRNGERPLVALTSNGQVMFLSLTTQLRLISILMRGAESGTSASS